MLKRFSVGILIAIIILCSACAGIATTSDKTALTRPTEYIDIMVDHSNASNDLMLEIHSSDTIVLGTVEEVLPSKLITGCTNIYTCKEVITPVNIKVIQSLEGEFKPGEIFKTNQLGGDAEGVHFEVSTKSLHNKGEIYLFFIGKEKDYKEKELINIIHSEHVTDDKTIDGYYFNGKTTDEAASIISDCIKNDRMKYDKDQIKSFELRTRVGDNLYYYVDKTDLKEQISSDTDILKTEKWDTEKWNSFLSELKECGVFDWERYYEDSSDPEGPDWELDMQIDIGYVIYFGLNAYPDNWDSFMKIIDKYFGTLK